MKTWNKATRILFIGAVVAVTGALLGWLGHVAEPTRPLWLSVLVFMGVLALLVGPTLSMVLWPSKNLEREQEQAEHSIERAWVTEASASAFFWLAAGLIVCLGFGEWLHISWLSTITILHVIVLAALAFGANYIVVRRESVA